MTQAGVSQHVAMRRSGHVSRRYGIVSEPDLRDIDAKVAAYLAARREPSVNRQTGRRVVAITEKGKAATC